MKKIFAMILTCFIFTTVFFGSSSLADGLPVSFGMNKEEVKAIMGKPSIESDSILTFEQVSFSKFKDATFFCNFYNDVLFESAYYYYNSKNITNDMDYLKKALISKYGNECNEDEANNCMAIMEIMGPYNLTYIKRYIWKDNGIYIILLNDDMGTVKLIYLLDLTASAYNTNGI